MIDEQSPQGEIFYNYDVVNRLSTRTIVGQPAIAYAYDNADRLTGMSQGGLSASFAYDDAGRQTQVTMPNGVAQAFAYDPDSRISHLTWSSAGGPIGDLGYVYDDDGRITQKTGSLALANLPQPVSGIAVNAANQMVSFGGAPLSYDANGNLLSDGTNSYVWDTRNRLASIGGPVSASFVYDAFARRVSKNIDGETTQFQFDASNPVQEIDGAAGNVLTNMSFSRLDLIGNMTFLTDLLGSTVALTDDTDAIQTLYNYEPFGNTITNGASSTNPYQGAFHQNDRTGLY